MSNSFNPDDWDPFGLEKAKRTSQMSWGGKKSAAKDAPCDTQLHARIPAGTKERLDELASENRMTLGRYLQHIIDAEYERRTPILDTTASNGNERGGEDASQVV